MEPLDSDPKIPILLVHRTIGDLETKWEIIVPKGWGLPIWRLLIYAGVRAISLEDRQSIYHEAGLPCYPHDYPETTTCLKELYEKRGIAKKKFDCTPKAKRPNFKLNGISNPFMPDFKELNDSNDGTDIVVLHSTWMAQITQSLLDKPLEDFTLFVNNLCFAYTKLLAERSIVKEFVNLTTEAIKTWFCRVKVDLSCGHVEPNSRIYGVSDGNEDKLV